MTIRRMDRTGVTTRKLGRASATALGLGLTAVLALSGCAQSDVGGTGGSASDASVTPSPSPDASDTTSPSPSDGAEEDGSMQEAATMDVVAGSSGRGLPPGIEGSTESSVGIAWSPLEGLLYVVTNGSSSCPTYAEPEATLGSGTGSARVAAEDGVLTVQFVEPSDGICTMDFVPTTTVVEAPVESDTGAPIPVVLGDRGQVELLPREAEGEPGPVAWLDS